MLALALAATAAAMSAAGYQSMAATGQWYGKTFAGIRPGSKELRSKQLALTYDDGPNDPHTLRLLEVLAKHNVKATFFLVGRYVEQRPDIVREVVNAGHIVGNHTFSHPNLIFASARQTRTQLQECQRSITQAIGQHSPLFRPPFGGRRPGTLRIARSLGLVPVMWNVSGQDWKGYSADEIKQRIRRQVRGGDLILLHDGRHTGMGVDRSQTILATDLLIAETKSEGFGFVTIPEMMNTSGVNRER
jgi:peptidoglycan/xylan/chitin deacetylase (PgdA/CDA1 family)